MTESEVLQWYARAWHFVYRHGYGGALAEDLVHEMMVDVLAHPTRRHHLRFVLLHAKSHVVPHVYLQDTHRPIHYVSLTGHEAGVSSDIDGRLWVDEFIQRCPAHHQWWLRLIVFEDWKLQDVALVAGVTPSTITHRLYTLRPLLAWAGGQHKHGCAQPRNHANREE